MHFFAFAMRDSGVMDLIPRKFQSSSVTKTALARFD
jgi:hypothetical protein